jgi:hypothetical protein
MSCVLLVRAADAKLVRHSFVTIIGCLFFLCSRFAMAAPTIVSTSPYSGTAGAQVTIHGSGFGSSQGASTVRFYNNVNASVQSWSDTQIVATVPVAATSGPVRVTVGGVDSNVNVNFTVPLPRITGISPTNGVIGSQVTISGSGFQGTKASGSVVRIGGYNANTTSWSDTQIVATVPAGARTGPVVVTVSNVGNDSNSNFYFTLPNPIVTGISPGTGYNGSQVVVTGSGFGSTQGSSILTIWSTASVQSWSDSQIVATIPPLSLTTIPVSVSVTVGGVTSNGDVYFTRASPVITNITPSSGVVGTQITINGSGFGASTGYVRYSNGNNATVNSWSDTQIVGTVSSTAVAGPIRVYANNLPSNGKDFSVPTPAVMSVLPGSGPVGTQVTINGYGFGASQGNSTIRFNGYVGNVVSWSDTQIVGIVPITATSGSLTVVVGGISSNTGVNFAVAAPRIESLTPTTGVVGTRVTITGSGFQNLQGANRASFNSSPGTIISWSDTSIVADVPAAGALTGPVTVTVNGVSSNADRYFTMPNPVVTGVSPDTGLVGTPVTVSGTGFGNTQGTSAIRFGTTAATSILSWSDTLIVAAIPSGAPTNSTVSVLEGGVVSNTNLTVTVGTLLVQSFTPMAGGIGTQVTISGTGFGSTQGTSRVAFNSVNATSVQSWSNTQIVATVPAGATTGALTVTVSSQTSNSNKTFTVANVAINLISPSIGPVGTQVTISGTGFGASQGSSTVQFNSVNAASIQSWSPSQIVATVPATASGPVRVTAGGVNSNNTLVFTVPEPRIDSVSPSSGPIASQVTISGANFGAFKGSSFVMFNGVSATTSSWSDSQIVATVPTNAATGYVRARVNGVDNKEQVVFTLPNPTVNSVLPASGVGGTQITVNGLGFGVTQSNSTIYVGDIPATVQSWSDTEIVALTGASTATGAVRVTVGGKLSNGNVYFTVPLPRVDSIVPDNGVVGTTVVISGANFGATRGTSSVSINSTAATVTSWSDTQIIATIASGTSTGSVRVNVKSVTNVGNIVFSMPNPVVDSVSPNSATVNSQVVIYGRGFGEFQGSSFVTIAGLPCTVISWNDSQIRATVPATETTGTVLVTVGGVGSNNTVYLAIPKPRVISLTPNSGPVGTQFAINGERFRPTIGTSQVLFSAIYGNVISWSDTQVIASVPVGGTTGPVRVRLDGYGDESNNDVIFTLPNPQIAGVAPAQGPVLTQVTISGTGFGSVQGNGYVRFSNQTAAITSWSDTQIVASVPTSATTGKVVVTAGGVSSNAEFYFNVPPPRIDALSPSIGGVGTPVTITGLGFQATQGTSTVRFNNYTAQVVSWSDTQIVAVVPSGATTGAVRVTVNTIDSNTDKIYTVPSLVISSVSPTSGAVGTQVTINGTAFGSIQGSSTVSFNGSPAASIQSWSNTQIVATVPVTATTGPVKVTVNDIGSNQTVLFTVPPPSGLEYHSCWWWCGRKHSDHHCGLRFPEFPT